MKKKVGLLVGYNGEGYYGLQFNKELKTIEREIVRVLLKNECITEINSLDPQKIDLKSSSRTDKGVHASFNLIAVKIIREPNIELFDRLRDDLDQIGVHLYKIVTLPKSFLSYKQARSRIYKYTIPTYFCKESNFEMEWKELKVKDEQVLLDGSENKRLKCNNIKELGDNIKNSNLINILVEGKEENKSDEISQDNQNSCSDEEILEESEESYKREGFFRNYLEKDLDPIKGYKLDSIKLLEEMLKMYEGTHNFHNFTLKRVSGDVKRYIMSIKISEPFYKDEIEYVEVSIHGQSFLLHQIRKMISFAVLNCRFARTNFRENFNKALSSEDVHVPKCPSQYLFLNHVFFNDFNRKRIQEGQDSIDVDEKEKEQFEKEKIYPSILTKENLFEWLKYLDAVRFHHEKFNQFKN